MRISDWSSDVCSSDLGGALVSQAGNPAASVKPADCAARWRPQIRAFGRQEQARCGRGSLVQSPHNNSFKPNALRYTKHMADKACHVFGSTTHVGLTQALGRSGDRMRTSSILFLAALLASCTSQRDYDFLVGHAITSLAVRATIETVVLTPQLPDQARSEAAKHYKTIDQSAVVPVLGLYLAHGLFGIKSVTISEIGRAHV